MKTTTDHRASHVVQQLQQSVARYLTLNRSRLLCLLALTIMAMGSLGQLIIKWQPESLTYLPWDVYLAGLVSSHKQGNFQLIDLFDTPQGPFASAAAAWQYLGYAINSHMTDPLWQTAWRGLWRVVMLALLFWVLSDRRNNKANWFIALSIAAAAAIPVDWMNLLFTSGTSQLMALCTGLLAIHCWTTPPSSNLKNIQRYLGLPAHQWRGWGWYALSALCGPTALLAAPVAGVVALTLGCHSRNQAKIIHGLLLIVAGALCVSVFWLSQGGPEITPFIQGPIKWLTYFATYASVPFTNLLWPCVLLWLPWAVTCVHVLRTAGHATGRATCRSFASSEKLVALGCWSLVMTLLLVTSNSGENPWANHSCLVLGLAVNTAALLQWFGRAIKSNQKRTAMANSAVALTSASVPASSSSSPAVQSQPCMNAAHWVLLLWCMVMALGYWHLLTTTTKVYDAAIHQPADYLQYNATRDNRAHRFNVTGKLSDLSPEGIDLSEFPWIVQQPNVQAAMPALLQPPLRPSRFLATGAAVHPVFAPSEPLFRENSMGIVGQGKQQHPFSRLGLQYPATPGQHYFLLKTVAQGVLATDFSLALKTSDQESFLLDEHHPLPLNVLILNSLLNMPLRQTFLFKTNTQPFELNLVREPTANDGIFVFRSPQPIGHARYRLEQLLPWSGFVAGLGLTLLLFIAGRLFLPRFTTTTNTTRSATDLPYPPDSQDNSSAHSSAHWNLLAPSSWLLHRWTPVMATVLAAAVILFIRKSDALLNPQFWAEDGTVFFSDQYNHGLSSIFMPYAGYLHLVPRMMAHLCGMFTPYIYLPHAYNGLALGIMLLAMAALFSRRLPFSTPQKILMAFAMVCTSQLGCEIFINITNLQWFMAPLLALTALKTAPDPRLGSVKCQWAVDLSTLIFIGFTGPFVLLAFPLYAVMAIIRKNRHALVMLIFVSIITAVQLGYLLNHDPHQPPASVEIYPFAWVLSLIVGQRVFKEWILFGLTHHYLAPGLLCTMLAGVWIGATAVAARQKQLRWPLLCLLAFHGLALAAGLLRQGDSLIYLLVPTVCRYFYIPLLMLTWMLIILLGSHLRWQRHLSMFMLASVMVASLQFSFMALPWPDLQWRAHAQAIESGSPISIPVNPASLGFKIQLNQNNLKTGVPGEPHEPQSQPADTIPPINTPAQLLSDQPAGEQ